MLDGATTGENYALTLVMAGDFLEPSSSRNPLCSGQHGAADEGMTHRVLIFGLCGFKSRYKPVERTIKAHEHNQLVQPRSQDLTYTARTQRRRPS
jgi:hypothetical protein